MKRLVTFILVLMVMAVLAAPVAANNGNGNGRGNGDGGGTVWNKKKCEDAGGYWHNDRGVKSCNFITEQDYDGPDIGEGDPEPHIRDFLWDNLEEGDTLELGVSYSQRGNVGIRGTAATFATSHFCKKLGVGEFLPQDVCDFLQREYGVDRNPLDL